MKVEVREEDTGRGARSMDSETCHDILAVSPIVS